MPGMLYESAAKEGKMSRSVSYYVYALAFITLSLVFGMEPVHSQPFGYIFVFSDENHSTYCVNGEGIYSFESWIWCWPGDDGCIEANFSVGYPSNVQEDTTIVNDMIVSQIEGDLSSGVRVELNECQYDWFWMYRQVFYAMDNSRSQIYISLESDTSHAFLRTCASGNPARTCCACSLFVNYSAADEECFSIEYPVCNCSLTSTKQSSWGAIKSVMKPE